MKALLDGRGHAGLILLPPRVSLRRDATGGLADAIASVMRANPDGIASRELWLAASE